MKVSDFISEFIAQQGIRHVYVVQGGAAAHLIDSVALHPSLQHVCPQHEQAAAMAADAYSRIGPGIAAAIGTSGPGMTNMITGICSSFYDSIPVLFITGQVSTFRLTRDTKVRQLGFQEAPASDIARPIVKYTVLIDDPKRIRYELEKAVYIAKSGRPGPVLVDVCDDVQREEIDPEAIASFSPPDDPALDDSSLQPSAKRVLQLLKEAQRPVIVYGAGVLLSQGEDEARALADALQIPIGLTWATKQLFNGDDPRVIGTFGINGTRRGNFAIQNADLVVSIGSRLDTHATGTPVNTFARGARKIIVDIDAAELEKFPHQDMEVEEAICTDARTFLHALIAELPASQNQPAPEWIDRIAEWKHTYPDCPPEFYAQKGTVNPYVFFEMLSEELTDDDIVVLDTGASIVQFFQVFRPKIGQKLISAFNYTPMGYAVPASLGAAQAAPGRRVVCITGDGGFQLNSQELSTIVHHNLPVKVIVMNNHGYGIIQQTQDDWLGSRHWGSRVEGGLPDSDEMKVAGAYGLPVRNFENHDSLQRELRSFLNAPGPIFGNVEVDPEQRLFPMLKAGRPIEDAQPLLDRNEFRMNMIVEPLDVSQNI